MIETRVYGLHGAPVIVLHGGPGASGYMASLAQQIADEFRVIEPLQRSSGEEPLTVDFHAIVDSNPELPFDELANAGVR